MPTYNKLVRDKIPQVIAGNGKECRARVLNEVEYRKELNAKLVEELNEYLEASTNEQSVEELADILEVIRALSVVHGASPEELEAIRVSKSEKRGGFLERVYLIDVDD